MSSVRSTSKPGHPWRQPLGLRGRASWLLLSLLGMLLAGWGRVEAADPGEAFDAAARLYAQGQAAEAAAVYESLLTQGVVTPSVLFNQGNAWLQAGQTGRAIASFRRAQELAPRDPEIASGLQRARAKVHGAGGSPGSAASAGGWIRLLTPNEWAWLAVAGSWLCFGLLAARRFVPRLRESTRSLSWLLAVLAIGAGGVAWVSGVGGAGGEAVVTAPEAVVRFGPLEESQPAFNLPNGAEVRVLDRKNEWLQVRDGSGRGGWLPGGLVARLR